MEIHPPHAIRSVKDLLLQLFVITLGIIIALSLEGILEAIHHGSLRREAVANLLTEIRENRPRLAHTLAAIPNTQGQLQVLLSVVQDLRAGRKPSVQSFDLTWYLTELHSTSWTSATETGATSYMDYSEVKRYTELYDLQREYVAIEDRAFQAKLGVDALAVLADRAKSGKLTETELDTAEQAISLAMAELLAEREIGTALRQQYDKF